MFRQAAQVTRRDSSVIQLSHRFPFIEPRARKINIRQSAEENVSRVAPSRARRRNAHVS